LRAYRIDSTEERMRLNQVYLQIELPILGLRTVTPCVSERGHWLWLDLFGRHDCTRREDAYINKATSP
jgi:hypothetical protein